jgi:hypothetical protein
MPAMPPGHALLQEAHAMPREDEPEKGAASIGLLHMRHISMVYRIAYQFYAMQLMQKALPKVFSPSL